MGEVTELRRAAALMRERAGFADAGPYSQERSGCQCCVDLRNARGYHICTGMDIINAEHVASWHPAVALTVADLLEAHAEAEVPDDYDPSTDLGLHLALNIARTYLGETR